MAILPDARAGMAGSVTLTAPVSAGLDLYTVVVAVAGVVAGGVAAVTGFGIGSLLTRTFRRSVAIVLAVLGISMLVAATR